MSINYYHTNDKEQVLARSHYSNPAFDGPGVVIFGKDRDGLQWEYDDRLREWDWDRSEASWDKATAESGEKHTAQRVETYLRHYFDDPTIELECIVTGTRRFDGYPWHAYGFTKASKIDATI